MKRALVDQDVQPFEALEAEIGDRLDLVLGVEATEDALIDALQGKQVLFATSRLPVTGRVLRSADDLELVSKIGTGIDNIDLDAATELGIPVTHTPGLNAASVAEYTVGLAIAVCRDMVPNQETLRAGGWRDEIELSTSVNGKTVGIVGFGRIGSRVAAYFSGFNVELLAYDPYVFDEDTDITGATLTSLEGLLSRSDIVTVNAELTEETRGLVGASELSQMKESAVLVNTARGPVVDESALIDALEAGDIAGAGLDVFETEPLPASSPLHEFDNVVATPHTAATTTESRLKSIKRLADNTKRILDGGMAAERYMAVDPTR